VNGFGLNQFCLRVFSWQYFEINETQSMLLLRISQTMRSWIAFIVAALLNLGVAKCEGSLVLAEVIRPVVVNDRMLRGGIYAYQSEIDMALKLLRAGWIYVMPIPKSPQASWSNYDERTTWFDGWWVNKAFRRTSIHIPESNGIVTMGDGLAKGGWRRGGSPGNPSRIEWMLSKGGGIFPKNAKNMYVFKGRRIPIMAMIAGLVCAYLLAVDHRIKFRVGALNYKKVLSTILGASLGSYLIIVFFIIPTLLLIGIISIYIPEFANRADHLTLTIPLCLTSAFIGVWLANKNMTTTHSAS
jgi:hypothetical protein